MTKDVKTTISFVIDDDNYKSVVAWAKIMKLSKSRIINILLRRALKAEPKVTGSPRKSSKLKKGGVNNAEEYENMENI